MLFIDYKDITDLEYRVQIPWIDGSDRRLYRKYGMLHTGVSIPAKRVYSYSQGVVVSCGVQADKYFITIQYDGYSLFRYCNLGQIRYCFTTVANKVNVGLSVAVEPFNAIDCAETCDLAPVLKHCQVPVHRSQ